MQAEEKRKRLLDALFPRTVEAKSLTGAEYMQQLKQAGISCEVEHNRLFLLGGNEGERERLMSILQVKPELEAWMILHIALTDRVLMDVIEERACIRWAEGASDSLYCAVMCNFAATDERIERDAMGRVILKPKTDWEAEVKKYR